MAAQEWANLSAQGSALTNIDLQRRDHLPVNDSECLHSLLAYCLKV